MGTVDAHSETWEAIETELRQAIEKDLRELAEFGTGEHRSQQLRGRIDMAGQLLAMATQDHVAADETPDAQADPVAGY